MKLFKWPNLPNATKYLTLPLTQITSDGMSLRICPEHFLKLILVRTKIENKMHVQFLPINESQIVQHVFLSLNDISYNH